MQISGDRMVNNYKTDLVLMMINCHTVFCYFKVSDESIKDFKDTYGGPMWNASKPMLKVYTMHNGEAEEADSIFIDTHAECWYINLNNAGMDVYVRLGRIIPDNSFVTIAESNTVTTPRSGPSLDNMTYYIDTSSISRNNNVKCLPEIMIGKEKNIDYFFYKNEERNPDLYENYSSSNLLNNDKNKSGSIRKER